MSDIVFDPDEVAEAPSEVEVLILLGTEPPAPVKRPKGEFMAVLVEQIKTSLLGRTEPLQARNDLFEKYLQSLLIVAAKKRLLEFETAQRFVATAEKTPYLQAHSDFLVAELELFEALETFAIECQIRIPEPLQDSRKAFGIAILREISQWPHPEKITKKMLWLAFREDANLLAARKNPFDQNRSPERFQLIEWVVALLKRHDELLPTQQRRKTELGNALKTYARETRRYGNFLHEGKGIQATWVSKGRYFAIGRNNSLDRIV